MDAKNSIHREDYIFSETEHHLRKLFESEKIYRDTELNLQYVSNLLGISKRRISTIIKITYGKSFSDFINDMRLEEVIIRLKNKDYETHTMIGLSEDAGFPSKSTFYRHFKKCMGISPSQFTSKNNLDKM